MSFGWGRHDWSDGAVSDSLFGLRFAASTDYYCGSVVGANSCDNIRYLEKKAERARAGGDYNDEAELDDLGTVFEEHEEDLQSKFGDFVPSDAVFGSKSPSESVFSDQ